jgi:hypothetical protein
MSADGGDMAKIKLWLSCHPKPPKRKKKSWMQFELVLRVGSGFGDEEPK